MTPQALHKIAMCLPDVEVGIACAGTALESTTFKARNKAFLFLNAKEIRFKLQDSIAEAEKLAATSPDCCSVGSKGWVKLVFTNDQCPPARVLEKWIGESYRLFAQDARPTTPTKTPKKKAAKKKPATR